MRIIYAALVNSDLTEGRGPMVPIGHYFYLPDARKAVVGRSTQGTDGEVREICVWDSFEEADMTNKLRASGLKKLTTEEKKALGLQSCE